MQLEQIQFLGIEVFQTALNERSKVFPVVTFFYAGVEARTRTCSYLSMSILIMQPMSLKIYSYRRQPPDW